MALNKRKYTYIVLIAILLINLFMVSANAVEHEEKVITPRFSYINFFQNDFNITSYGKSQMSSYLNTYNSEEVRVTEYLQQYKDGSWKNVKNWTKSIDGTSIMLTKKLYVESGINSFPIKSLHTKNISAKESCFLYNSFRVLMDLLILTSISS